MNEIILLLYTSKHVAVLLSSIFEMLHVSLVITCIWTFQSEHTLKQIVNHYIKWYFCYHTVVTTLLHLIGCVPRVIARVTCGIGVFQKNCFAFLTVHDRHFFFFFCNFFLRNARIYSKKTTSSFFKTTQEDDFKAFSRGILTILYIHVMLR